MILKLAGFIACALLLLTSYSPRAQADQYNQLTHFTFSAPFEIPGFHHTMVLPAGTYTFKLLDSLSDRDIVQIFNKDQSHLYATILAIPDYRLKPTGKSVIQFTERAANSPEAIKAWFYPGDLYGQEFVYPKSRAVELAKANNEPVPSISEEAAANMSKPIKSANEPAVKEMEKAPVLAERPNGQEVPVAQALETKPHTPTEANNNSSQQTLVAKNNSSTLPKTASEMPLALLCGTLLLGFGAALRLLSQRLS